MLKNEQGTRDKNIIVIDTANHNPPQAANTVWGNRANNYYTYDQPGVPVCSIIIQAFNRLPKTKYCVECVLRNTADVDFELILVDNGSSDGTYEFFESVRFERKKIIRVTKNVGSAFPSEYSLSAAEGKYIVTVPNDVYVTKNWLSNLLRCYESDPSIGLCMMMSSNVSNWQHLDLEFSTYAEMQDKAAAFNVSDPDKWEERMRLITITAIFRRDVLDMVGAADSGFLHDFREDDLAVRLRRNGYRLVLCKDTWVHHDHDYRNLEDKDPAEFQASIESGRATYAQKWHGIDAWDDINNFEFGLLAPIDSHTFSGDDLSALCVDVRCGTPVLEVRNRLRRRGITNVDSYAFTTQVKYFPDLNCDAVCGNDVVCDRIDYIQGHYADNSFDMVVLGAPVNTYNAPITLLQRLYNFLKPGGLLLFKVRNTDDYNAFMLSAGIGGRADPDMPVQMPVNEVGEAIKLFGGRTDKITSEQYSISETDKRTILGWVRSVKGSADNADLKRLLTRDYLISASKP
jgi:GT2 family glycosyltransferase/SAM-dependent methyltransferase